MINLNEISYVDCDVEKRYQKDIDKCDTLEKLKSIMKEWKPLALDAFELVNKMDNKKFNKFRKSLALERKGKYAEDEDAIIILLPNPMFKVSTVSMRFNVPFGCALHRLMDLGEI